MALNKQIWINQIKEGFYPDRIFLSKVVDLTESVDVNSIHFPSAGIDPNVLINNKTYPIAIVERSDDDNVLPLDKFETENTLVRRPDAIEYSYNKLESVIRQHRSILQASTARKAAHAYAPNEDTTDTPLVMTSGTKAGNRKRMTFDDLLSLKERFDNALIPLEDRYIVLHPSHVSDLLREDMNFFKELTDIKDGEPMRFAGFGCFHFPYMPTYKAIDGKYQKEAFNAKQTEHFASVAFYRHEVMKADGEIYMYARYDDPEERGTIVGFDKRFIALPIRNKGIGAIISAPAE